MKIFEKYKKTTGKVKEKSGKNQSFFFLENIRQIQKILEKSKKNQGFAFLENILQIQQKLEKSGSLSLEHFSKVGTMYSCLQNKTVLCVLYVCPKM